MNRLGTAIVLSLALRNSITIMYLSSFGVRSTKFFGQVCWRASRADTIEQLIDPVPDVEEEGEPLNA